MTGNCYPQKGGAYQRQSIYKLNGCYKLNYTVLLLGYHSLFLINNNYLVENTIFTDNDGR